MSLKPCRLRKGMRKSLECLSVLNTVKPDMPSDSTEFIGSRCSGPLKARVKQVCRMNRVSISDLTRIALLEFLERHPTKAQVMEAAVKWKQAEADVAAAVDEDPAL